MDTPEVETHGAGRAPSEVPAFMRGGGQCGALMRSIDWSKNPLGPPELWPAALKTTIAIILHSRHPMFLWWGPELIQFYNDAYAPSFGQGKHPAAMGQPGEACWPEIWPIISPQIRDVMERGIPSWHENQLVPIYRNGAIQDVFWTYGYSPVFDADQQILGTLVVCQETTDYVLEKRAVEAARREADTARDASRAQAELIPQQVWTARPGGQLDFVNERVLEYFGASRADVLGHGWAAFVHPDDLPTCDEKWRHSLQTGDNYEIEFRLLRQSGEYRWHLGRAVALRNAHGQVERWFGTNTDIDDQKQIRERLRAQSEFEQHLLGIVSHDLRTPLHVIALGTEVLAEQENRSAASSGVLLRIQSATRRGIRMINDLMDFTQARLGGGLSIQPRDVDLSEIVDGIQQELLITHPERAIEVVHACDGRGRWDPDRIAQLLVNLITNAIQYGSPVEPIKVLVRGDGEHLVIEVKNQGPVITPDVLPKLFEPMQRGKRSSTERSIGLGLYIVQEIARRHGGSVGVDSNESTGTTFAVRLPRYASPPVRMT